MTSDLRLLLDECLRRELADEIKKWSSVNAVWVNDTVTLPSTEDEPLMDVAREQNRILVTEESRLDDKRFTICTHPGIIVFRARKRHASTKADLFRQFMLSGQRRRARKAVTFLKTEEVIFKEMGEGGAILNVSYRWDHIRKAAPPGYASYCKWPEG